jgi:hypothetical protein
MPNKSNTADRYAPADFFGGGCASLGFWHGSLHQDAMSAANSRSTPTIASKTNEKLLDKNEYARRN